MKTNRTILTLLFVFALLCSSAMAQTDEQKSKTESNAAETPEKQIPSPIDTRKKGDTIQFPDIKGWRKSPITKYPQPELGYSQSYDWPEGGRVTIYVYNGGRNDIRNSLSGAVAEETDRAKAEIFAIQEMGYYTEVKELKSETANLGGTNGRIKALKKTFNYKQDGVKLYSELIVLPFEGNFFKVRATRIDNNDDETKQAFEDLLNEIESFMLKYMETTEVEKLAINLN